MVLAKIERKRGKNGKNWKNTIRFFWALNRGLKLADDTKFVLGENDAEHRANICFFSIFWAKIYIIGCKQRERFCPIFLGRI